jgi:biopolymer transport protein TolQ
MPILDLVMGASLLSKLVLAFLAVGSLLSWTVIFAKWRQFGAADRANGSFLRIFRKSQGIEAIAAAAVQHALSPLAGVFEFGYAEVQRQFKLRGRIVNKVAIERSLQMGLSEELASLERNMSWLATTASVSPFVGLFGTVLGIINSFQGLGTQGSASLRAVAPGIADALIATAAGLAAAIPAAISYNQYTHRIRELGARMEDFSLEFLNLTERAEE